MVALKNKLVVLGALGFLVAACTVTSTTTNTGDGGSSSGSSGTSSGSSGASSGSSGASSGSSGASSGSSGASSGSSGEAGACTAKEVTINNGAGCNACAHSNCQTALDACFKDLSATGCECQAFSNCANNCANGDAAGETDCLNTCASVHGNAAGNLWLNWNKCINTACGAETGTGVCN